MGYFDIKANCSICGKDLGLFTFRSRLQLADGWLCSSCIKNAGGFKKVTRKKDTKETILKKMQENNKKDIVQQKDEEFIKKEKPKPHIETFHCVGESFDNEDGINRQKRIKQITQHYKRDDFITKEFLYGGLSNKEIIEFYTSISEFDDIPFLGNIKEYNYQGERAFAIYLQDTDKKEYKVANIARKDIDRYINIIENKKVIRTGFLVDGGKTKYVGLNENGKDVVKTKNLDYGIRVIITYENLEK